MSTPIWVDGVMCSLWAGNLAGRMEDISAKLAMNESLAEVPFAEDQPPARGITW